MFIYLNKKRGQSTAEYVIVLGLIVGAVVAMQTYIKRGLQGRMKNAVDYTDQGGQTTNVVNFDGDQYEPYYLTSNFTSFRNSQTTESLKADSAVDRGITNEFSNRSGDQTIGGVNNE